MKKHRESIFPLALAVGLLTALLAFKPADVSAQGIAFPRIFREDPGSCSNPGQSPLETQTTYNFDDEDGPYGDGVWAYVGDPGGTPQDDEIYICPPVGESWASFDLEVSVTVYQHSTGDYRNEHRLEFQKGLSVERWWYTEFGAACGDGAISSQTGTEQLPFSNDLSYDTPYRLEWVVRAASNSGTCYGYAEQQLAVSFVGWVVPETFNYCPDGTELISSTVTLQSGEKWVGNTTTAWSYLYTRYVFSAAENSVVGTKMWLGSEMVSRHLYVEPGESTVYTYTVPNRTEPNGRNMDLDRDYQKYGSVPGPVADLQFENLYDTVSLLSACVLQASQPLTPSAWCPSSLGVEILSEGVDIAEGGKWETTIYGMDMNYVTVKYVVEDPYYGADPVSHYLFSVPAVEYTLYLVRDFFNQEMITFTLPTTGVIKMYDSELFLEYWNYSNPIRVRSICVIDATNTMLQKRAEECHLTNPDFVYGVGGWSTSGSVLWDFEEENGAVDLSNEGTIVQTVDQNGGTVWKMEIRARQLPDGGNVLTFGTDTENLIGMGTQFYQSELGPYHEIFWADVFVKDEGSVQVSGNDAIVDYVCLIDPDDVLPVLTCDRPVWDPQESGDPLLIYLIKFLADVMEYLLCLALRWIAIAANRLFHLLENVFYRMGPVGGEYSWTDWVRITLEYYANWIAENLQEITGWFPTNAEEFGRFLEHLYHEFIFWLGEQLQIDPFFLLELLNSIWDEALLFWDEVTLEADAEFEDLLLLLQNMGNVLIVLVNGVREGVSGETIGYIGDDFTGVGAFIWTGVDFLNAATENTPLTALNIVALGAIALTLMQWTIKKFVETLEAL